jgi:hypothetical protein
MLSVESKLTDPAISVVAAAALHEALRVVVAERKIGAVAARMAGIRGAEDGNELDLIQLAEGQVVAAA